MRRLVGAIFILACLAILIHDAASGRFRTFRDLRDERYIHHLFSAVGRDDLAEVRRLVRIVGDIDAKDTGGRTAPHRARSVVVAQLLLDRGANVNAKAYTLDMTPLHLAIDEVRQDIARLLIASGADVNARDRTGSTPLHFAAKTCQKQIAELLIRNGADVNARTASRLPLRLSSCLTRFETRATPLDVARSSFIITFLRKHGGKTRMELDEEDIGQKSEGGTKGERRVQEPGK
ncbi:MAG: ankyrin repeat domain-containing protein [Planctomycetota bacterium]